MASLFDKVMKNPEYQRHLKMLKPDERKEIEKSLRQLTELFEAKLLKPLENIKQ